MLLEDQSVYKQFKYGTCLHILLLQLPVVKAWLNKHFTQWMKLII